MTTTPRTWSELEVHVTGVPVPVLQGGNGAPLLVLPHDIGNPGWLPFHETLAQRHHVIVPTLPGYDGVARPDWMTNVRDMAVVMHFLLDRLDQQRIGLVGLGFGGWLAAEMATMNQRRFSHMVLVGAAGLPPAQGEILDQFLLAHEDFVRAGFRDQQNFATHYGEQASVDQLVQWDVNREMTARIAWKPYMYNRSLPTLLAEVRVPTLVVWGGDDAVVPGSCAQQYLEALPNARLQIIEAAGHYVEMEQAEALAAAVTAFMAES